MDSIGADDPASARDETETSGGGLGSPLCVIAACPGHVGVRKLRERGVRAVREGGKRQVLCPVVRLQYQRRIYLVFRGRGLWAAAVLLAVLSGVAGPAQAQPADSAVNQFVGDLVCSGCHGDVSAEFRQNPHYDPSAPDQAQGRAGCESCHGQGALHAISADKSKIDGFTASAPSEVIDRCLVCHGGDFGKLHVRRSAHTPSEVGCVSCHSVHAAHPEGQLLAGLEREVCYRCHANIRARFEMPFKHRVNEGAIACSDCHNPHGAPLATWASAHSPRMISQGLGNDQPCLGCHVDLAGPFVFEHPPLRVEGCAACHDPHGSTNPRLLSRPAVFVICLECHNEVDGFGPRSEGIIGPTPGFHNLSDPSFRECVLCHSRIHRSNADPLFRR